MFNNDLVLTGQSPIGNTVLLSFCQLSADLSSTQDVPRKKFTALVYCTDKWQSTLKKIDIWIIPIVIIFR